MSEDKKSSKNTITQATRFKAGKLIEEHIRPVEGSNLFYYANEWTDDKIAKLVSEQTGERILKHHVAYLRRELFGEIQPVRSPNPLNVGERLETLEKQIAFLAESLGVAFPED